MAELAPPGVEVVQEFTAAAPSIITPQLMACIVGPCKQKVEATNSDGSVNSSARTTLPAFAVSTASSPFTGLGGKKISVKYKGYVAEDITFAADPANPDADQVVEQFNAATPTGLLARKVTHSSADYVMIYTTAETGDEYFTFQDPASDDGTSILGYTKDYVLWGYSKYNQWDTRIPDVYFPDPNNNLDELSIDRSSVRIFLNTSGTTLKEAERDESIVEPYNEVTLTGADLSALTYSDDLMDLTFIMTIEGESAKTCTFFQELRADLIAGINEMTANYEAHRVESGVHGTDDTTNTLASTDDLAATATLVEIQTQINDINTKYEAHDLSAVFHTAGNTHQITTPAVSTPTWEEVRALYNDMKQTFNEHIADAAEHSSADTVNFASYGLCKFYNECVADYEAHRADSPGQPNYHPNGTDTTNTVTNTTLVITDNLSTVTTAIIDLQDKYDLHDADGSSYHGATGGNHATSVAAVTTFAEAETALDDFKTKYNAHLADITNGYHTWADTDNQVSGTEDIANTSSTTVINDINATWSGVASLSGSNLLLLTSGSMVVGAGTANSVLEFTSSTDAYVLSAVDDGDGDTYTPWVEVNGADFTASAAPAKMTGTINLTTSFPPNIIGQTLIVSDGGNHSQTLTFDATVVDQASLLIYINGIMGAGFATVDGGNQLELNGTGTGYESKVWVGAGTGTYGLGLTPNTSVYGVAFKPLAGDELWVDNARVGTIIQVSIGSNTDQLILDTEVSTSYTAGNAYIIAKDIPSGSSTRPTPDLTYDDYSFTVKHDFLRDGEGQPASGEAFIITTYEALRLDVTPDATNPSLLVFETTTDVTSTIPPVDETNPLALGSYFALLNSPSSSVSAIGVTATSTDYPEGTVAGYTSCTEFLEGREVYGLAPLTQAAEVHSVFATHVTSMSQPANKKERIVFINPDLPSKELDTTVSSGTDGESTATPNEFDTKLADLVNDLVDEGLNPASLTYDDGVYLDIDTDSKRYNLSSVVGTLATCRVSFSYGDNTDNYFTEDNLPSNLVQEDFSVRIKGASISSKTDQADAYAATGTAFSNRRVIMVVPDEVVAPVDGTSTELPGFYLCAGIAGMVGEYPPQQPFSNMPLTGYTTVNHSYPYFTDSQLNTIAGGGGYIIFQPEGSTALVCRHQLTTDVSTVTKRELSVTKALDFAAKFYRLSVRSFVGRYNITGETLDFLSMIVHAASEYLIENQVLLGADQGKPVVSTSEPDHIQIEIDVEVGIPGNKVTITLVV
jgi:hypothetical protein